MDDNTRNKLFDHTRKIEAEIGELKKTLVAIPKETPDPVPPSISDPPPEQKTPAQKYMERYPKIAHAVTYSPWWQDKGDTPEERARWHYDHYGKAEGRVWEGESNAPVNPPPVPIEGPHNPNLQWFGWYRVIGKDYNSNLQYTRDYNLWTEAAPYSNLMVIYDRGDAFMGNNQWSNSVLNGIKATSDDRQRYILDIRRVLFKTVSSPGGATNNKLTPKSYPEVIDNLKLLRKQIAVQGISHKIFALMVGDEPIWNGLTQQELEWAIRRCKEIVPQFKTFIVFCSYTMRAIGTEGFRAYSNGQLIPAAHRNIPNNLDIISHDDGYNYFASFNNAFIPATQKILQTSGCPMLLTFQSMGPRNTPQPARMDELIRLTKAYFKLAREHRQIIGMLGWPFADFNESMKLGAWSLMKAVPEYRNLINSIANYHFNNAG